MKNIISWLSRLTSRVLTLESGKAVYTAAGTVSSADAKRGAVVANPGATGAVVIALPAAVPGMEVTAIVEATQQLRLDPNGTETVAGTNGVQGAAGKFLWADAVGEHIRLICVVAGTWDVAGFSGTWTHEA